MAVRSFALVLGAGGAAAGAFHAGVLAALHDVGGVDPRSADLIVGTSAGANTAGTLRAGISAADHLARQLGEPLSAAGSEILERVRTPFSFDRQATPNRWPLSPRLAATSWRRSTGLRPGHLIAGLGPRGTAPTDALAQRGDELHPGWPGEPTWVCAVRVRDGRRVVFGRDDTHATFGQAVASSSAIPGEMQPVTISRRSYVDGAVFSPTNADLVAGAGYHLVVVSAPMSADRRSGNWRDLGASRAWHRRLLAAEVRRLERRAIRLVVEPDRPLIALLTGARHDPTQLANVARAAYDLTTAALTRRGSLLPVGDNP